MSPIFPDTIWLPYLTDCSINGVCLQCVLAAVCVLAVACGSGGVQVAVVEVRLVHAV